MNVLTFVHDAALSTGFLIVSSRGPTCIEVAGNGDWSSLQQACKRFVERSYRYDHVSIIVQGEDGSRELRDVGTCDLRNSGTAEQLPSVNYCKQVAGRTERTETLLGVYPSHGSFSARVQLGLRGRRKFIYLGLYKTRLEAAKVRDRYVIEHDVNTPLNFSGLLQGDAAA